MKKERVIHTRVSAVLEEELRRFADNLQVLVSNLIRTILEDALALAGSNGKWVTRSSQSARPVIECASKSRRPSLVRDWASINQRRELADRSNVRGLEALRTLDGVELHLLPFRQGAEALPLNCAVMTENVLTPIVLGNETEALRIIEPLHCASCHGEISLTAERPHAAQRLR